MCGFVGVFGSNVHKFKEGLNSALTAIQYRGPDARGVFADDIFLLGHNRLKIIDLSDSANQPFEDKHFALVVNGEIYNYIELQQQFRFQTKTNCDSEILFQLLEKFRDNFSAGINWLNGMFAFAFYDKKRQSVILCRDRLGVKPLYYTIIDNQTIIFASEIKAILSFGMRYRLNHKTVVNFLVNRTLSYNKQTFFDGIQAVPPGSYVTCQRTPQGVNVRTVRYWNFPATFKQGSFPDAVDKFRELFFSAVTLRLRSDVTTATLLSGGLDSSAVTSTIAALSPQTKILSISAVYDGDPFCERTYAEEVTRLYPNIEPVWLNITSDMAEDTLDKVIYHQETPIADGSMVSHFLLMRALKKLGVTVLLTGQGGDEILGGYVHTFLPAHYADCLRQGKVVSLDSHTLFHCLPASVKNAYKNITNLKNNFPYIKMDALKNVDSYYSRWGQQNTLSSYLINSLRYWSLPGFLHYEDRNTMAYSIEGRGPFLDYRLVEFMLTLPNEFKIRDGVGKMILRESLKGILPERIRTRKDKQGFYAPINKWIAGVDNRFLDSGDFQQCFPYINCQRAKQAPFELRWKLYTLWIWHKIFSKSIKP